MLKSHSTLWHGTTTISVLLPNGVDGFPPYFPGPCWCPVSATRQILFSSARAARWSNVEIEDCVRRCCCSWQVAKILILCEILVARAAAATRLYQSPASRVYPFRCAIGRAPPASRGQQEEQDPGVLCAPRASTAGPVGDGVELFGGAHESRRGGWGSGVRRAANEL